MPQPFRTAVSIQEVVESGLCIGCGLCESATEGRVQMHMSDVGAFRPVPANGFSDVEEASLLTACPGVVAPGRGNGDRVWGPTTSMSMAWAGNPTERFVAATGGVLSALCIHLLETGKASFILHVGPDPDAPMRTRAVLSESSADVMANAGSRYGPTSPLMGLAEAIERDRPFAVVAKPCDIGAVTQWARTHPQLENNLVATLAMVCGGQSRISKSTAVLDEFGVTETAVSLFRYRGHGNPGPTRVETLSGDAFEKPYLEMWEDEAGWDLDARCTVCPDALGEMADVAAADAWPGGAPTGEDEGFNAIAVRSERGQALVDAAVQSGHLVLGEPIDVATFDDLQPHQVRKKRALIARFEGRAAAGLPIINTPGLRLEQCAGELDAESHVREREGTQARAANGRYDERSRTERL